MGDFYSTKTFTPFARHVLEIWQGYVSSSVHYSCHFLSKAVADPATRIVNIQVEFGRKYGRTSPHVRASSSRSAAPD